MASINKLLSKINQATSAINSVKGIKSKIQGKGYLANVDKLVEQAEEAKRKLDKRRQSLQKNQEPNQTKQRVCELQNNHQRHKL